MSLEGVTLDDVADLHGARFSRTTIGARDLPLLARFRSDLSAARLLGLDLRDANLTGLSLLRRRTSGIAAEQGQPAHALAERADLSGVQLDGLDLRGLDVAEHLRPGVGLRGELALTFPSSVRPSSSGRTSARLTCTVSMREVST